MKREVKPLKPQVDGLSEAHKCKILRYATDTRKFEIELFWRRSLFFWGFIGAAFVAFAELRDSDQQFARTIIGCFGFVCSIAWTLLNRGSKYWQEAWEQKVEAVEETVLGVGLFANVEPREFGKGFWGARRFSVSGILIALSDFTVLVWIALLADSLVVCFSNGQFWISAAPAGAVFIATLYAVVMGFENKRPDLP